MTIAPYGTWSSPLSAQALVAHAVGLSGLREDDGVRYWIESRPSEAGRQVLVRQLPGGPPEDFLPAPFSNRTLVQEYGGSALLVHDGTVYFSNFADQRIYRFAAGSDPVALTPEPAQPRQVRFADFSMSQDGTELLAVRERHEVDGVEGWSGVVNDLVAISIPSGNVRVLASGHDFYAAPRISPDGCRVAFLSWDLPNMPWDGTELSIAEYEPGAALRDARVIAGSATEWVSQPRFDRDGRLHFLSDRTGYLSLYDELGASVVDLGRDLGEADWVLGQTSYLLLDGGRVLVAAAAPAGKELLLVDGSRVRRLGSEYSDWSSLSSVGDKVAAVAGSATRPSALVLLDLETEVVEVVRVSQELPVDTSLISVPEAITFPTSGGEVAHGLYYPPTNPEFVAPEGELAPLVVISHGGPTSRTLPVVNLRIQYLTSRGIGVVDVNYRGSTGFGRAYRDRLNGSWGVVDVEDCEAAARYLAAAGRADPKRLAIKGGSAGGYTTLCALTFTDTFAVGASHFGVSDLIGLCEESHKFECRYTEHLVAPYPDGIELYRERSPLFHAEGITCPMIFFQGLEDAIVPPNQAEQMVEALRKRHIPVAYLPFEGEQHGFRKAESIVTAAEAELVFFGAVLGFEPDGPLGPVLIENADALPGRS